MFYRSRDTSRMFGFPFLPGHTGAAGGRVDLSLVAAGRWRWRSSFRAVFAVLTVRKTKSFRR